MTPKEEGEGSAQWLLSREYSVTKEEKGNFTVEKSDTRCLSQGIKVNVNKSCYEYVPLIWCGKNGTLGLWSSFPKPITLSKHQKNLRHIPMESTKYPTGTPQNGQGHHQKQEKSEKLPAKRSLRRRGDLTEVVSRRGFTDREMGLGGEETRPRSCRLSWCKLMQNDRDGTLFHTRYLAT